MENQKVQVKGGKYSGGSYFIRRYKVTETEVDFKDEGVSLLQGSGFVKAKNSVRTNIRYNDITSVSSSRKYSVPNVVFAVICAILGLIMGVYVTIFCLFMIWLGRTAVVKINYAGTEYTIPTEFINDAHDLETKINSAIAQSRA